jgi:hypothetical protein
MSLELLGGVVAAIAALVYAAMRESAMRGLKTKLSEALSVGRAATTATEALEQGLAEASERAHRLVHDVEYHRETAEAHIANAKAFKDAARASQATSERRLAVLNSGFGTIEDAASLAEVPARRVRSMAARQRTPFKKVGSQWVALNHDIEEWAREMMEVAQSDEG